MSSPAPSPRRVGYLRIFLLSLVVLVAGLLGLLFGITMEATASATGYLTVRGAEDVRTPRAGIVELGWYEAADVPEGSAVVFHKLQPGDRLAPGQHFATVSAAAWWQFGDHTVLSAPPGTDSWLVAEVAVHGGQAVSAGQRIVTLIPVDDRTGQPREWLAEMDVDEEHAAEIEVGQAVRIYSNLYNHRLHGTLDAVVERIDPMATIGDDGRRHVHVVAVLDNPHLRLMLGSGFRAEIVLGRKRVYRIILEH